MWGWGPLTSLGASGGESRVGLGAVIREALFVHRMGFICLYIEFWNPVKARKRES